MKKIGFVLLSFLLTSSAIGQTGIRNSAENAPVQSGYADFQYNSAVMVNILVETIRSEYPDLSMVQKRKTPDGYSCLIKYPSSFKYNTYGGNLTVTISDNGAGCNVELSLKEYVKQKLIKKLTASLQNNITVSKYQVYIQNQPTINNPQIITQSTNVTVPQNIAVTTPQPSDVDINIPTITGQNPYRFALIIGNEDYNSFQTGLTSEANVMYASNDATIFKEYAKKTLGINEENIVFLINGKTVEMSRAIKSICSCIKNTNGKAEIVIFYAGHGFPDENTKESYIIPVDVSAKDLQFGIKLSDLYSQLSEYPSKKITIFLDACFSGGARNQGLLEARGVKVKPKEDLLKGNIIVFTASSGDQSSLPYKDKQHGLFTYFLLKKIQETNGDITYKDLSDYLTEQVGIKSSLVNQKEQNPQIIVSPEVMNSWQLYKLK
jgi:hypothetical protein